MATTDEHGHVFDTGNFGEWPFRCNYCAMEEENWRLLTAEEQAALPCPGTFRDWSKHLPDDLHSRTTTIVVSEDSLEK